MKLIFILATALCVATVSSYPIPEEDRLRSEALDRLVMVEADNVAALRSKRTIGILRELFPEASQMVEQKVNSIVAEIIRVLGPTLLRSFLGNNQPAKSESSSGSGTAVTATPFDDEDEDDDFNSTSANGSKVSIALPTFPPDEENTEAATSSGTSTESTLATSKTTTSTATDLSSSSTTGTAQDQEGTTTATTMVA